MRRTFKATLSSVDEFCQEVRATLLVDLSSEERFAVELLLREALLNAVIHGSGNDPLSEITCSVERVRQGIRVRVADPGTGFDWRAWRAPIAPKLSPSGHGLHILHSLGSEVKFNDRGNILEITRWFGGHQHGN